jgi:hypothetical protein
MRRGSATHKNDPGGSITLADDAECRQPHHLARTFIRCHLHDLNDSMKLA